MSDAEASPRLLDYLAHVVEAIERINHYAQGMDELAFATDQRTQDAVIRNFEVIGEACQAGSCAMDRSTIARLPVKKEDTHVPPGA